MTWKKSWKKCGHALVALCTAQQFQRPRLIWIDKPKHSGQKWSLEHCCIVVLVVASTVILFYFLQKHFEVSCRKFPQTCEKCGQENISRDMVNSFAFISVFCHQEFLEMLPSFNIVQGAGRENCKKISKRMHCFMWAPRIYRKLSILHCCPNYFCPGL